MRAALDEIWSDVLGITEFGRGDNFFDLGGRSVDAVRLVGRVRREVGLALDLKTFFSDPTFRAMEGLHFLPPQERSSEAPSADHESVPARSFPVNWSQRARLARAAWAARSSEYDWNALSHVMTMEFVIVGSLEPAAMAKAVSHVAQRHDALRARFRFTEETAEMYVDAAVPSLQLLAPRDLDSFRSSPFELSEGPLARFGLVMDDGRAIRLVICIEHMIADGWSIGVLLEDLRDAYVAQCSRDDAVHARPLQLAEMQSEEHRWLGSQAAVRARNYWHRRLHGIGPWPRVDLPFATTDPTRQDLTSSEWLSATIGAPHAESVRSAVRGYGVTLYPVIAWSFAAAVFLHGGNDITGIITPTANRINPDYERVIGWQSNLFILRQAVETSITVADGVMRAHNSLLEALDHSRYPIHLLAAELKPELRGRPRSHPCLYLDVGSLTPESRIPLGSASLVRVPESVHGPVQPGVALWVEDDGEVVTFSLASPRGFLTEPDGRALLTTIRALTLATATKPGRTVESMRKELLACSS